MSYCCSQCSFTAQFESALTMHRQLHHEAETDAFPDTPPKMQEKSKTTPRDFSPSSFYSRKQNKGIKLPGVTSSATRLFDRLRAKISRSRTLFVHQEEADHSLDIIDLSARSECTSKARLDSSRKELESGSETRRETYSCHICNFDADRITVLDRHLLNDHKIGLENLLKLVLAKTKDGLADETTPPLFETRTPYYKPLDDITDDGEYVFETVAPKVKILKHTATNTDLLWSDIPDLKDNCRMISNELSKLMKFPLKVPKDDLMMKMQALNEYMCKFVDSTNTLKKVLSKECLGRSRKSTVVEEPFFELGLGDINTPRDWERAHSEQLERNRHDKRRGEKSKLTAESYYF